MDENLKIPNDNLPALKGYPSGRYNFLFILIIVMVIFLAIRFNGTDNEKIGMEDSIGELLIGDVDYKLYYIFTVNDVEKTFGFAIDESILPINDLKIDAIRSYLKSAIIQPNLLSIRRLIITEKPDMKEKAIVRMEEYAKSKDIPSDERKKLRDESSMWRYIYITKILSSDSINDYSKKIKDMNLGFYAHLVLADLYELERNHTYSDRIPTELNLAYKSAVISITSLVIISICIFTLGLLGIIFIILYLLKIRDRRKTGANLQNNTDIPQPEQTNSYVAGYLLESFVVYILSNYIIQITIGLLVSSIIPDIISENKSPIMLIVISEILALTVSIGYIWYRVNQGRLSWDEIGLKIKNPKKDILWGIAGYSAALPLIFISSELTQVIDKYMPSSPNPVAIYLLQSGDLASRFMLFILICINAPFFEELFFRGALFNSFRSKWGVKTGIVISSVIFALLHPFPISFLPIFIIGSIFSILAYERKSLAPNIIMHAIHNTLIFTTLILIFG